MESLYLALLSPVVIFCFRLLLFLLTQIENIAKISGSVIVNFCLYLPGDFSCDAWRGKCLTGRGDRPRPTAVNFSTVLKWAGAETGRG
jgi:hypothetical protein